MLAFLVVDHGSRAVGAHEQLEEVAAALRARSGRLVAIAHLELIEPSIDRAMTRLAEEGATEVEVLPYFLAKGRHASVDVPRIASESAARLGLSVRIAPPLGPHALLVDLLLLRAAEAR
jgi:sirohydrochlorin ferrochelatase